MNPFFIIALPRSRTAWLSYFLTSPDCDCLHDPLGQCESLDDLQAMFDNSQAPLVGCVDTSSPLFFDAIHARWPDSRYLFVFREPAEIVASLNALGLPSTEVAMMQVRMNSAYLAVRSQPNVRALPAGHLSELPALEAIHDFLVGTPFDAGRATYLVGKNIQVDLIEALSKLDEDRMLKLLQSTGVIEADAAP